MEVNADNVLDIISIMKDNALPAVLPHPTIMEKNVSHAEKVKAGMEINAVLSLLTQHLLFQ